MRPNWTIVMYAARAGTYVRDRIGGLITAHTHTHTHTHTTHTHTNTHHGPHGTIAIAFLHSFEIPICHFLSLSHKISHTISATESDTPGTPQMRPRRTPASPSTRKSIAPSRLSRPISFLQSTEPEEACTFFTFFCFASAMGEPWLFASLGKPRKS